MKLLFLVAIIGLLLLLLARWAFKNKAELTIEAAEHFFNSRQLKQKRRVRGDNYYRYTLESRIVSCIYLAYDRVEGSLIEELQIRSKKCDGGLRITFRDQVCIGFGSKTKSGGWGSIDSETKKIAQNLLSTARNSLNPPILELQTQE